MVFRIDLKIFLFLVLYYLTNQVEIYGIIMIFAIIHELCHLLAGILLGMKVKKVEIMPVGISIEFKLNTNDYNTKILKSNILDVKKMIIALAGPISNMLIIIVINILKVNTEITEIITYSNLLIVLFNLLPIYPLDGGRILKALFSLLVGKRKANTYIYAISNISLFIITCLFSILVYYYKNIALVIILIYVWYITYQENKIYKIKKKLYKLI
jgi:stage IV sporulation protein FB